MLVAAVRCAISKNCLRKFTTSKQSFAIDRSKVPTLEERDLEEQFISGSGPGGQSVNKSVNCCSLKHKPTGLRVKVHQSRSLIENRKLARQMLIDKLDNLYNGENSVSNQKRRINMEKLAIKEAQKERLNSLKESYKKRLVDEEAKRKGQSLDSREDDTW